MASKAKQNQGRQPARNSAPARRDPPAGGSSRQQVTTLTHESFSGLLPPPKMLAEYEEMVPGFGVQLMDNFHRQAEHRQALELKVVTANLKAQSRGQVFAFVIALFGLGVAGWVAQSGHEVAGSIIGSVDLVALVTVFIVGRRGQQEERTEGAKRV